MFQGAGPELLKVHIGEKLCLPTSREQKINIHLVTRSLIPANEVQTPK